LIVESDGSEIDWHIGYGPPPEDFLKRIQKTVDGVDTYKVLSESYAKEPKNVEVVFKLARKYNEKYDDEKSSKLFNEVIAIDPEGKMGTTDFDDSKVTYTEYAEYSLGSIPLWSRPGDPEPLKAFIGKYSESEMISSAYSQLSSYYRSRGTKEEARGFFEEYVSKFPENVFALNSYVSRIIRDKDNLDRGIELSKKIQEIMRYNPDPSYLRSLAELYSLKGEDEKTEEVYGKRFMERNVSRLASSLRAYAEFWVKEKSNTESAEEMIELAIKLNPDNPSYLQSAARIYSSLEKPERALEVYGPAYLKKHMDDADTLHRYARFWGMLRENLDSALKTAKLSLDLDPDAFKWDTLALIYQNMKKYDEALIAAKKAVEQGGSRADLFKRRLDQIKRAIEKEKN
jgi:tetratricopeptide (TPR) repeat protein